jgi:hypothetical protein
MNDDDEADKNRSYIDDSVPASLRYYGRTVSCATLHEAIIAWRKLPEEVREDARIKVDVESSHLYQASENCEAVPAPAVRCQRMTRDAP